MPLSTSCVGSSQLYRLPACGVVRRRESFLHRSRTVRGVFEQGHTNRAGRCRELHLLALWPVLQHRARLRNNSQPPKMITMAKLVISIALVAIVMVMPEPRQHEVCGPDDEDGDEALDRAPGPAFWYRRTPEEVHASCCHPLSPGSFLTEQPRHRNRVSLLICIIRITRFFQPPPFIALSHASGGPIKWRPPYGQSAASAYLPHLWSNRRKASVRTRGAWFRYRRQGGCRAQSTSSSLKEYLVRSRRCRYRRARHRQAVRLQQSVNLTAAGCGKRRPLRRALGLARRPALPQSLAGMVLGGAFGAGSGALAEHR